MYAHQGNDGFVQALRLEIYRGPLAPGRLRLGRVLDVPLEIAIDALLASLSAEQGLLFLHFTCGCAFVLEGWWRSETRERASASWFQ